MNILVTGASKGIGFEIVRQFAKDSSNNIIALARDIKQLKELKVICKTEYNNEVHIYSIDFLAETFNKDLKNILDSHSNHFDVVINNAGYLINRPF